MGKQQGYLLDQSTFLSWLVREHHSTQVLVHADLIILSFAIGRTQVSVENDHCVISVLVVVCKKPTLTVD